LLVYFHVIFFLILIWILVFHYTRTKNKKKIHPDKDDVLKKNWELSLQKFLDNKKR
jgi:hypothetical protein